MLAERLVADKGLDVEVLTSCALDAITWRDELPEGTSVVNGVRVHRIRSASGRDEQFHPLWARLREDPARASPADMERWVDLQGPRSPALLEAVAASDADVLAFYPYLYYPTVRGLPLVAARAILHPAAHEEPALHLPLFDDLFARCRGFAFHSRSERALVTARFGVAATPQVLIGLGVEEPPASDEGAAAAVRAAYRPGGSALPGLHRTGGRPEGHRHAVAFLPGLQAAPPRPAPARLRRPGRRRARVVRGHRPHGHGRRRRQVGAAARRPGARGTVAPRVVLAHGDRGPHGRRPGPRERGVRRHARALRAVGGRAVVLRFRRIRSRPPPAHHRCARGGRRCRRTGAATWRRPTPGR